MGYGCFIVWFYLVEKDASDAKLSYVDFTVGKK